jgi:hypothetical protein
MGMAPGAPSAFKGLPQTAKQKIIPAGTGNAVPKTDMGGGTTGFKLAAPSLESMATSNPALGAMFGLLFGRVMNNVPGLKSMLSNPVLRDITLGAAVAAMVEKLKSQPSQPAGEDPTGHTTYNPRPSEQPNGWSLQ